MFRSWHSGGRLILRPLRAAGRGPEPKQWGSGPVVVVVRYHQHHHHHHHHQEQDVPGDGDLLAERFARGESLASVVRSRMSARHMGRLSAVAGGTALCGALGGAGLPALFVGALTTLGGAWPTMQGAVDALRKGRVSMDLSMSIGILAALASGETFTSSLMTTVVLLGNELEEVAVARSEGYSKGMSALTVPSMVEVVVAPGESTAMKALAEVGVGEIVRVRPGGMVPVDGVVMAGGGAVDESGITGESLPLEKSVGQEVFAGCICQEGVLDVIMKTKGAATVMGRIVTAVSEAEKREAPAQKLADSVAKAVVYFALTSSAATYLATGIVDNAVSVLVVAGACGIALGTPLAIVGGIGRAACLGVIIKGGNHLENLTKVNAVVFDKTGTLTKGKPAVQDHVFLGGEEGRERGLQLLLALGGRSEHPVGMALAEFAKEQMKRQGVVAAAKSLVRDYEIVPGLGVSCVVDDRRILLGASRLLLRAGEDKNPFPVDRHALPQEWQWVFGESLTSSSPPSASRAGAASEVIIVEDGKLLGALKVSDELREETLEVVHELRRRFGEENIHVMSGDRRSAVLLQAKMVGIPEANAHYELSPFEKQKLVSEMVRGGVYPMMVGDGVNDAPSMSEATCGVAMRGASALTQRAADVVLMDYSLRSVVTALDTAHKTKSIIYQNVVGTLLFDVVGSAAAAYGLLGPVLAASLHGFWDVAFISNSARLLLPPRKSEARRQRDC